MYASYFGDKWWCPGTSIPTPNCTNYCLCLRWAYAPAITRFDRFTELDAFAFNIDHVCNHYNIQAAALCTHGKIKKLTRSIACPVPV